MALGKLTLIQATEPPCISGSTCEEFEVSGCQDVTEAARGEMVTAKQSGRATGLVAFFSGSNGTGYWGDGGGPDGPFFQALQDQGLVLVQVRWLDPWLVSAKGEDSGPGHLACRPATVIDWIHANVFKPLGVTPKSGACGFCVTGNSGGASQVSYALSFFELDSILDGVFPTSGPPHAALAKGCAPENTRYSYPPEESMVVDASFGYEGEPGPCTHRDAGVDSHWQAESVDTGGSDFDHPNTRIEFIIGADDCGPAPAHAADYRDRLMRSGTSDVTMHVIEGMGHDIAASKSGLAALQDAILDQPIRSKGEPCYPLP